MISEPPIVAQVVLPGTASGALLRLDRPISLWGGVDPKTGNVIDPRHPQFGRPIAGTILAMERSIGSSSGSSILLELMAIGKAPAGIVLAELDAIVTLGAIVGREMGYPLPPIFRVAKADLARLPARLRMLEDGRIEALNMKTRDSTADGRG